MMDWAARIQRNRQERTQADVTVLGWTAYPCELEFRSRKTGDGYTVAGITQRDIIDQLAASPHVLNSGIMGTGYWFDLKAFNLTNFPLVYSPFVLRSVNLSGIDTVRDWMKSVMIDLFPESIPYVEGHKIEPYHLKGGRDNRHVFFMRILRSWDSKRTSAAMQRYLWRRWFETTGSAIVDVMPRGAPSSHKKLATFTSQYTISVRHPEK